MKIGNKFYYDVKLGDLYLRNVEKGDDSQVLYIVDADINLNAGVGDILILVSNNHTKNKVILIRWGIESFRYYKKKEEGMKKIDGSGIKEERMISIIRGLFENLVNNAI